jgi:hypothetical protein
MTKENVLKHILAEIPESSHPIINQYFPIIWTAGFDEGRKHKAHHHKKIIQKKDGHVIQTWPSITEAANNFGVTKQTISKAVNNKTLTSCGFEWGFL